MVPLTKAKMVRTNYDTLRIASDVNLSAMKAITARRGIHARSDEKTECSSKRITDIDILSPSDYIPTSTFIKSLTGERRVQVLTVSWVCGKEMR